MQQAEVIIAKRQEAIPRPRSRLARTAYVPEIDGLRAVAVFTVLLFHLGIDSLSGGYVGVDVFFVISGYLITGILVRDVEQERFSYVKFMARRIARLYPALIATLLGTMALGFLLFAPGHYEALAKSTLSSIASVSNFEFWHGAGYFDTSSETNPLLHTWSLGVEQQFYILWPLIILLGIRLRPVGIKNAILITGLISLGLSHWFTTRDPMANYFLMPFRVFEFAIGAGMVWVQRHLLRRNAINEALLGVGIALIIYSALKFDQNIAFPGLNALLPTVGAALCIYAHSAKHIGILLRNRLSVYLGAISYSLYLVHWPIIVFYKYYVYRPLASADQILILSACIGAAVLLHKYVEEKYRRVDLLSLSRPKAAATVAIVLICTVCGASVMRADGMPSRVDIQFAELSSNPTNYHRNQYGGAGYRNGNYDLGPENSPAVALVLGDSYARQYAAVIDELASDLKVSVRTSFHGGCVFSLAYTRLRDGQALPECPERVRYAIDFLQKNPSASLIFSASWANRATDTAKPNGVKISVPPEEYPDFIVDEIKAILKVAKPEHTLLIGIAPGTGVGADLSSCLSRPLYIPSNCQQRLTLPEKEANGYAVNRALEAFAATAQDVHFFDPYAALCKNGACRSVINNSLMYSDSTHLSKAGAHFVLEPFVDDITALLQPQ